MKMLKCNAKSCAFNKQTTCVKQTILVGDGMENNAIKCESYTPLGSSVHNYEIAEESVATPAKEHMQPHINCRASSCVYNKKHSCTADDVLIDTESMDTYGKTICETYRKN